jgi:hypothetical protein
LRENPAVFKEHFDAEYMVLSIFIMYEIMKGTRIINNTEEKSYWHPYFQIIDPIDIPFDWSEEDLDQLEDKLLKAEALEYQQDVEEEWSMIREICL